MLRNSSTPVLLLQINHLPSDCPHTTLSSSGSYPTSKFSKNFIFHLSLSAQVFTTSCGVFIVCIGTRIPMAEEAPPSQTQSGSDLDPLQYWCYHCDKRVSIETLPDVVCHECKNGFVESIAAANPSPPPSRTSDLVDEPYFGSQFLQVLRLIAQAARDDDAPPPPPSEHADPSEDDYLRIELDGWDNDDDDDANEVEVRNEVDEEEEDDPDQDRDRGLDRGLDRSDGERDEEDMRRRRRDVLRLRLRDLAARAANRRNRILDWAEILMGLEDHSIELRLQMPEMDDYVGNPEDYVDAAGYEALLQNLAESDGSGRRGAPQASKSAILALQTLKIESQQESMVCAICKDSVNVGEIAKKLPCEHGYHEDCILPWLGSRNSCPVCRFELETDDLEYEEERKKRGEGTGPSSSRA
ncbi:unnamed protein product [Camellia sinensis]